MSPLLLLRDVVEADFPILFEHQIDREADRMADVPVRQCPALLDHWGRILKYRGITKQAIVADGEVAGEVVVFGEPERRQIGYWIGRAYWGRGIATLALTRFSHGARLCPSPVSSCVGRQYDGPATGLVSSRLASSAPRISVRRRPVVRWGHLQGISGVRCHLPSNSAPLCWFSPLWPAAYQSRRSAA
jgi:hypothetical protein